MLPHGRYRRGRRREPLHVLLHARQLLRWRLLQAGLAALVVGVPDRGHGTDPERLYPTVHPDGRGRLSHLEGRDRSSRGADRQAFGQLVGTGRTNRTQRPRLRNLFRSRPGVRRDRRGPGRELALPRDLEQRLHGVLPGAGRISNSAAEAECRHRHGARAPDRCMQGVRSIYDTDLYQTIIPRRRAGRSDLRRRSEIRSRRCALSPTTPAARPS